MKAKTAGKSASGTIVTKPPKYIPSAMTDARCEFRFSDARSCGIPRWKGHPAYCLFHARKEQQLLDAHRAGMEVATLSGGFRTAIDLNHALGKLFTAVAQNRISARNATALAYIAQLLMQTVGAEQEEFSPIEGDAWNEMIKRTLVAADKTVDEDENEESDNEETANQEEGREVENKDQDGA
jgi:hypothetical protein